jgi:predicted amidophosphoribosyltransferase
MAEIIGNGIIIVFCLSLLGLGIYITVNTAKYECPVCHTKTAVYKNKKLFCCNCGTRLVLIQEYCSKCGQIVYPHKFCAYCGTPRKKLD